MPTLPAWVTAVLYLLLANRGLAAQPACWTLRRKRQPRRVRPPNPMVPRCRLLGPAPGLCPPPRAATKPEAKASREDNGTSNDRLFWTLPNFLTVENATRFRPPQAKRNLRLCCEQLSIRWSIPTSGFWPVSARLQTANLGSAKVPPGMPSVTVPPLPITLSRIS